MGKAAMLEGDDAEFFRKINLLRPSEYVTDRLRLFYGSHAIGWIAADRVKKIADSTLASINENTVQISAKHSLQDVGEAIADNGGYTPFNELFDVYADDDGRVLGQIDRGALPLLGLRAHGVHMNGLVEKAGTLFLWVGHRALHKRLDPGKLDHLVAGGVPAGLGPTQTLIKEAAEEAGITPDIIAKARSASTLTYVQSRPEGLRRDTLHCFDLFLPHTFVPRAVDGEVDHFELMPLSEVVRLVRETDNFKFNVNLVLIDLFLRCGIFPETRARAMRAALQRPILLKTGQR